MAHAEDIDKALNVLEAAERPLVIVGKGMAWSRAEDEVRAFIERTQVPFLASPMGKGVMDDNHPLSVGAARSHALQEADVIFLLGARLNWIMHFGLPPRFNKKVRIVQLDISPEAISQNVPAEVALVGDGKAIVGQLNKALENRQWFYPKDTPWHAAIAAKVGGERQADPADDRRQLGADQLLPSIQGYQRVAAEERGDHRRGRQHDGYRPHPDAEFRRLGCASMPAAMAPWESAWASPSPPRWCILTARSFRCSAMRRSASPAWRSRPPAATTCR